MIIKKIAAFAPADFSSANIRTAIAFLKSHDLLALPLGKGAIDGDKVYYNRQSYVGKPLEACGIESHRRYLDLQIVLKGSEKMAFASLAKAPALVAAPYDPVKDKISYTGQLKEMVVVHAGEGVLLYPDDIHQPCIKVSDEPIEKLVVKIAIDF
jgi:YhcH/YjgK/YiaL family protein